MKDDPRRWIAPHFAEAQRRAPGAGWEDLTRLMLELAYEADPDAFVRHLDALFEIAVPRVSGPIEAAPADDDCDEADLADPEPGAAPAFIDETEFLRRLALASITPLAGPRR